MTTALLTSTGHRVRNQLAAAGIELTPEQLSGAMIEATEELLREHPDGFCTLMEWALGIEAAIYRRTVKP